MRTQEAILADLLSGNLDLSDVKLSEVAIVEKIDKSGDEPKLVERRTMRDGICILIEKF
jgi:hypothetical protein